MGIQIEFRTRRSDRRGSLTLALEEERFLGASGDVVLSGGDVRARHARIFLKGREVHIEPIDGAPLAVNGNPITAATLVQSGDWLAVGSVFVRLAITPGATELPTAAAAGFADGRVIRIGRLETCDLVIPSPLVSRHHANLRCEADEVLLQDLDSTNGTFVNGQPAVGTVPLRRGDKVAIAAFSFVFTGTALEPADTGGLVQVEARGLSKTVRDRATGQPRRLLDGIDLVFKPGEFAAVFGSSGSGKSTLLDALNGRRPASSGQVFYNGADFYRAFDAFRGTIGYVPQQDIVHRRIPLQRALLYTARLRLPQDTTEREIDGHIQRVLGQVGLGDKAESLIDTPAPLSGGQLKRVSLAVELIANPRVLFLDEVTSGLDAGTDKRMMQLFHSLASDQKTVICVTHTLENIDVCHLVVLLQRGRLVYFGPPQEALHHFGVSRLSEVYELLESRPVEYWADRYLESSDYDEYIKGRLSDAPTTSPEPGKGAAPSLTTQYGRRSWSQLGTLMRRYLDLLQADRRNLVILLLQGPFVATLIGLVFSASGSPPVRAAGESHIAFVLVLSAIWCGCLNSTREVVKELPIYLRERAVNLGLGPYLLSKLVPLAVLCLLQSLALVGIATLLLSWEGYFWVRLLILFLSALAATGMGLAISTLVDSNDKAVNLVPILLIPQVIFSGAIVTLGKTGELLARLTMISFSAFDAMKTTMSAEVAQHLTSQWTLGGNLGMIGALFVSFVLAAFLGLKLKDLRH